MDQEAHIPIVRQSSECIAQRRMYSLYERYLLLLTVSAPHLDEDASHVHLREMDLAPLYDERLRHAGAGNGTMPTL
jgi:hypothetical protein